MLGQHTTVQQVFIVVVSLSQFNGAVKVLSVLFVDKLTVENLSVLFSTLADCAAL